MSTTDVPEEQNSKPSVVMVLCGLVGSGKSTLANALQREFPEFRRCNQDELGRRRDVENAVHAALAKGMSVCVDRTNIDPGQRRTWIDIAHQYPNVEIWGIQMDTPYEICSERLVTRIDHPTLKTPERAQEVLSRFARDLVPIDSSEGFNRVYRISPHHAPDFTRDELEDILTSIRATTFYDTPLPPPPAPAAGSSYPSRSRGFNPHRGRGRGYNDHRDWRSNPPSTEPRPWGSGSSPRAPEQPRGDWRSQDGGTRGFGGENRRPYRGGYGRGRGGWIRPPHGVEASRGGSPSNRGERQFAYARGGHPDGSRAPDGFAASQAHTGSPQTLAPSADESTSTVPSNPV